MAIVETAGKVDSKGRHLGYKLLIAYFIALKIWFDLTVAPMGDESYYWIWASSPASPISTIRRSTPGCSGSCRKSWAGTL